MVGDMVGPQEREREKEEGEIRRVNDDESERNKEFEKREVEG